MNNTTTTTKADKVRANFEKDLAKAQAEDRILAALADLGISPRFVCIADRELYGKQHTIKFGDDYKREALPLDDVIRLMDAFPAVPLTFCRDSCVWVATREWCDRTADDPKHANRDEMPICPVTVDMVQGSGFGNQDFSWYAMIPGFDLPVEFECVLPSNHRCGHMSATRSEYMGGFQYKDRRFHVGNAMHIPAPDNSHHIAEMASPTRYYASEETYGHWGIMWQDIHGEDVTTAQDIARAIYPAV